MLTAITRAPGPELARCELTHLPRQPIDSDRALAQHRNYQRALRTAGAHVIELPVDPALPDGVFVEDVAVVLDELAVITAPTPPSRRGERAAVEATLAPFREVVGLPPDALLEGGDVLRLGLDEEAKREYTAAFDKYCDGVRTLALRNGGRYIGFSSSIPLEEAVFGSLTRAEGVA